MRAAFELEDRFQNLIGQAIATAWAKRLPSVKKQCIWIAYSGGADSHLLLHAVDRFLKSSQSVRYLSYWLAKHASDVLSGPKIESKIESKVESKIEPELQSRRRLELLPERLQELFDLKVIHVNHQLSPNATEWAGHCQKIVQDLGYSLSLATVHVDGRNEGIEAAAREARYQAFEAHAAPGDWFFLGQHADDQLETLLYRLARGTGPEGLIGIKSCRAIRDRLYLRPFLALSGDEIREEAQRLGLAWIEDESNRDRRFDRNYLRHQVVPQLKDRWPKLLKATQILSDNCQLSTDILTERAEEDLAFCQAQAVQQYRAGCAEGHEESYEEAPDGAVLACSSILMLSKSRQINLLRHWLQRQTGRVPSHSRLNTLVNEVLLARQDRNPKFQWENGWVTRYNQHLYILQRPPDCQKTVEEAAEDRLWNPIEQPILVWQNLILQAEFANEFNASEIDASETDASKAQRAAGAGWLAVNRLHFPLVIKRRMGGERIKPIGDRHTRRVKKLLQEYEIPVWIRDQLPMIYSSDANDVSDVEMSHSGSLNSGSLNSGSLNKNARCIQGTPVLVAVGDLWFADACGAQGDGQALKISMRLRSQSPQ